MLRLQTHKDAVVKLHSGGILKEVLVSRSHGQEVLGNPLASHLREGVVHQPCIQPRHKCSWEREKGELTGL